MLRLRVPEGSDHGRELSGSGACAETRRIEKMAHEAQLIRFDDASAAELPLTDPWRFEGVPSGHEESVINISLDRSTMRQERRGMPVIRTPVRSPKRELVH